MVYDKGNKVHSFIKLLHYYAECHKCFYFCNFEKGYSRNFLHGKHLSVIKGERVWNLQVSGTFDLSVYLS